jgi:hypothetical protein
MEWGLRHEENGVPRL